MRLLGGNPGVEYRPEKFPGLVFRLKKPKTAILIFSTGKMVCTGAKSENDSKKSCPESRKGTEKKWNNHHQQTRNQSSEHGCLSGPFRENRA